MTIIINIIKTIISIPVFISAYIFFCLIIMGKIILKINRSIVNLLNNYLKNKGINDQFKFLLLCHGFIFNNNINNNNITRGIND